MMCDFFYQVLTEPLSRIARFLYPIQWRNPHICILCFLWNSCICKTFICSSIFIKKKIKNVPYICTTTFCKKTNHYSEINRNYHCIILIYFSYIPIIEKYILQCQLISGLLSRLFTVTND